MRKLIVFFMTRIIARANWAGLTYFFTGKERTLSNQEVKIVAQALLKDRFIGVSARNAHLSTLLATLGHFILTRRWLWLSHVWINVEDEMNDPFGIRIYESVSAGAITSPFWDVILCDKIYLLKPKFILDRDWDGINRTLYSQEGVPYDVFCKPGDPSELNCVERVVDAILEVAPKALPNLSKMIVKYKNITPQMLIECGDFEIYLEVGR